MVCGNFREGICREIGLDDIEAGRLLKLLQLACGKEGIVAEDVEELFELGELAERLQMEAARIEVEGKLSKELRVENCLEMIQRSEERGLERFQKECYKTLRYGFEVVSQKESFLQLSEEMMGSLLDENDLGASREECVFEAVRRWISNDGGEMRGTGLLRKIRYGAMSNRYLAGLVSSALLPEPGMLKELVGETMAKKGGAGGEGKWDGVERLCDKWKVARGMKGRVGAKVLKRPRYVAIDGQGRIVVTDERLHAVVVFNRDGSVARRFGSKGATPGRFNEPKGVAVDSQGHIVVADRGNNRIQVRNEDGSVVRCFGSKGSAVGRLMGPCAVAIDKEGHIIVADNGNHRIQIFDADGYVVRHFGSRGGCIGQFDCPMGVAVDRAGRIVVADWGNGRVQVFNGDGSCFDSSGDGAKQLLAPHDVAVDSAGRLVVADSESHRVQVYDSDWNVDREIGSVGDRVGEFGHPCAVAVDGAGGIVVVEWGCNCRVQVF